MTEPFETKSAPGCPMLNVLGGFAQFERGVNGERVILAMEWRFAQGKWNVQPPALDWSRLMSPTVAFSIGQLTSDDTVLVEAMMATFGAAFDEVDTFSSARPNCRYSAATPGARKWALKWKLNASPLSKPVPRAAKWRFAFSPSSVWTNS